MGKIFNLLERYVQWLALALGVAYLVYMAYAYLGSEVKLNEPPISAKIDGALVPPGEIDQVIVTKAVVPLEAAMKVTKDAVASVDPASSTFTISRIDDVDRSKQTAFKFKVLASTTIASTKIDWARVSTLRHNNKLSSEDRAYLEKAKAATLHLDDLKPGALVTVDTGNAIQTSGGAPIVALAVTLESPIVENVQSDYDQRLDEQKADVTALALNTSGAYQPPGVRAIDNGQKPPPTDAGIVTLPIPPAATPPTAEAKTYYTRWTVTMTGPPDAAGKPTRKDTPYFYGIFTVNSAELTKEMNRAYEAVPSRALNLLDPQFSRVYLLREEWVNGKWSAPKMIDPLPVNALQPYPADTANPKTIDTKTWYNYKNWMEEKASQALILDPQFYAEPNDVAKCTRPGKAAAGVQPAAGAGGVVNPAQAPPVINGAVAAPVVNKDREILAFDATIEEGKTYRYAVRYRLLNAVFDHKQKPAQPVNIDEIFDVRSFPDPTNEGEKKASEAEVEKLWTEPVTVEPTAQIFVTKVNPVGNQIGAFAQFAVFVWKDGHWKGFSSSKQVMPGDPVNPPAVAGKSSTGWTLVDVRKDPHVVPGGSAGDGNYVLLMDDHGTITSRDVPTDAANPDFARLKGLAGGANAAAMGPGAPPPGK